MQHIGQLVIANGVSVSNLSTATPFTIPFGTVAIQVTPSATGLVVEAKPSLLTFATTSALGFALGTASTKIFCNKESSTQTVLAAFNTTGGSLNLDVWVLFG